MMLIYSYLHQPIWASSTRKLVNTKLFYRGEGSLFVRPSGSESNTSMRPLKIDILTDICFGLKV